MSESKYCYNCAHVVREKGYGGRTDYFCASLPLIYGKLQRVDWNATCNNWEKEVTREDVGYKGGSSCFLTSACVDYLGKADDCEELTMLRAFRDNYMSKSEEGEKLVKEYYEVAPIIVEKIDASNKKAEYYADIYQTILKCIELIKDEKFVETQSEYVAMVKKYKAEFKL